MRWFTSGLQLALSILDLSILCMIFIRHEFVMQTVHKPCLRDAHDGKSQKKKIYYTFILCFYHICYNYQGLLFIIQVPEIVNIMNQTAVHCHFSKRSNLHFQLHALLTVGDTVG